MNYIDHYFLKVIQNEYWQFHGKKSREAYWIYILILFIGSLCISLISNFLGLYLLSAVYGLFFLIPTIGMSMRRLRDAGFSAWWILLGILPVIGNLAVLLLCAFPKGYRHHLKSR